MYQILINDTYKINKEEYYMFLNQLKALYHQNVFSLFKKQTIITFKVECNNDKKLEYFFDINIEEKKPLFESMLVSLFEGKGATVINRTVDKKYYYNNLIRKYTEAEKFEFVDFNIDVVKYILNSLTKGVALEVKIMYDHNEELKCAIKVMGNAKDEGLSVKSVSSTIQQLLPKHINSEGKKVKPHVEYNTRAFKAFKVTPSELLNLIFIPYNFDKNLMADENMKYLEEGVLSTGVAVGTNIHPLQKDYLVKIPYETMRTHGLVVGMTGAGKSSIFETMTESVLRAKVINHKIGFTLQDPKDPACTGVINKIEYLANIGVIEDKEKFYEKVKYIDFGLDNTAFKINLLDKNIPIDLTVSYFGDIVGSNAPRAYRYITNAIGCLISDSKEHHIEEVITFLSVPSFQKEVIARVREINPGNIYIKEFSQYPGDFTKIDDEKLDPIKTRIDPFINSDKKVSMFGGGNDLNEVSKWIEEGYIVMFNLSAFSPIEVKIILGYINVIYHYVGMQRSDNAHSHYLFIDECHDVQLSIFEKMLAKLRSKGVHLWFFTQYLEQMESGLLSAIASNTSTKIILRHEPPASRTAGEILQLDKKKIENLEDMTAYVKTADENKKRIQLMIKLLPPIRYASNGSALPYDTNNEKMMDNIMARNNMLNYKLNELMYRDYSIYGKKKSTKKTVSKIDTDFSEEDVFL